MSTSPASSEKGHGVGTVKNDDVPQDLPTEVATFNEQVGEAPPPASTESSGDVAAGPTNKKEDIDFVASDKDDAQGQPTEAAVGKTGLSTPQDPTSSKFKKPRLTIPTSSSSMEDGSVAAQSKSPVTEITFPRKLYDMLSNPDNQHAISWMPHGRSWKVRQKDVFMRTISPQYFSQAKFESFIRQANGWGFRRIRREGPDRNSYYNERFLRGKPDLMKGMRRPLPGEKASQSFVDPNFYNMPAMELLPHELDHTLLKQVSFGTPYSYAGSKKKRKKKEPNKERSGPGNALSDPYGGYGPYDSHWHGMPPPPPSPWGAPYAYSHPPDYGGYVPHPPPESAAAGWPRPPTTSARQGPGTNIPSPSNDFSPFDPDFYFPPYHPLYPPPPPPPVHIPRVSSQDQVDGGANDEFKMRPPDAQVPPPYFGYEYPPYPPPPHQFPRGMHHPPGDMPYYPSAEGGPTSTNPDSSAPYHYHYQFGSCPPNPLPPNPLYQGNAYSELNLERKDSYQFSPIQPPDES